MSKEKPFAVVTDQSRSLNRVRYGLIASVVILVLALVWLAHIVGDRFNEFEQELANGGADRAQIRADLLDQRAALTKANERLVVEGLKPVPVPPVVGPQGAEGRPPTAREIREAVETYCAANACRGASGSNVTRSQVAAAVSAYCDSRGECRGPRGNGLDGTDGADGAAGAQGPPPSDAQVAAAVAAFCADGRCRGAVGPPGPPGATVTGPPGPPGPACPDGFHTEQRTIITDNGPERAVVCVADQP